MTFRPFPGHSFFSALEGAVHALPTHRFVEIDLMAVEFGPFDTRETGFPAYGNPTSSAHAGSVDHQRVEADSRFEAVFEGGQTDELHHNHRSDGNDFVVFFALFFHEFTQQARYHTLVTFAAVIGRQIDLSGHFAHGIDQDQGLFVFGSDDDIGLYAVFVEPFDLRVDRSGPYSARNKQNLLFAERFEVGVDEFGGLSQRACKIGDRITFVQGAQFAGRIADGLGDDRHITLFSVVVGDGQRNPLAPLIDAQNDELSWLSRMSYPRSFDVHQVDLVGEGLFFKDAKHGYGFCLFTK